MPPQFGHIPLSVVALQSVHQVHSTEQINAPGLSAGKSTSQRSQFGLICNIGFP